jgi:hypothetical protein
MVRVSGAISARPPQAQSLGMHVLRNICHVCLKLSSIAIEAYGMPTPRIAE